MRIFLCANNSVGLEVARHLKRLNENIVGLGIHAPDRQKYTDDILDVFTFPEEKIFQGNTFKNSSVFEKIKSLNADLCISAFWAYLFNKDFIDLFPQGIINFHPGYLPYNRGKNPNVWPFIENSPCGVSLHYVDEGVDTGSVIAQRKVNIEPIDTGGTLDHKTQIEIIHLFKDVWPEIKAQTLKPLSQNDAVATHHRAVDLEPIDKIELDKVYTGRDLINILKARTFGERSFAHFEDNGRKVQIGVFLKYI